MDEENPTVDDENPTVDEENPTMDEENPTVDEKLEKSFSPESFSETTIFRYYAANFRKYNFRSCKISQICQGPLENLKRLKFQKNKMPQGLIH